MLVCDLEGNEAKWDMKSYGRKNGKKNKSKLHLKARAILHELYGALEILEEVRINVIKKRFLMLDFFIPSLNIAVEVQGQQHFKFNSHFHGNKLGFWKSRRNDARKKEWCEINNIKLIELVYNESDEQWKENLQ